MWREEGRACVCVGGLNLAVDVQEKKAACAVSFFKEENLGVGNGAKVREVGAEAGFVCVQRKSFDKELQERHKERDRAMLNMSNQVI